MYDIGTNSKKSYKIRLKKPYYHKFSTYNWPVIIALAINTIFLIATLVNPNLIPMLAMNNPAGMTEISWFVGNFVHAGVVHFVMNMLCFFIVTNELRYKFHTKQWVLWFLYIGSAFVIGPLVTLLSTQPVVGYSGVVMAYITFGILNKVRGYKGLAIYLVVMHVVLLLLPLNVSIITHIIGAMVGAALYLYLYLDKKIRTKLYLRKKNNRDVVESWRERHGKA